MNKIITFAYFLFRVKLCVMTEDRNFSRRMALKKFSNTPPFNMKGTESKGKFQKRTSIPPKCGTEYDQFVKIR